jgi:hypothetical protein
LLQELAGQGAADHACSGFPSAGAAAAAVIPYAVFGIVGIVGVARSVVRFVVAVVARTRVLILDGEPDGCACGAPFENS